MSTYGIPSHPHTSLHERHKRRFRLTSILVGVIIVLVLVGGAFTVGSGTFVTSQETGCVVEDKDRTTDRDGNSQMRIYTENCGVLSVKDNIFIGQVDSANIYGSIKPGETYDFTTKGYRITLLSMFPNITEVTPSK